MMSLSSRSRTRDLVNVNKLDLAGTRSEMVLLPQDRRLEIEAWFEKIVVLGLVQG